MHHIPSSEDIKYMLLTELKRYRALAGTVTNTDRKVSFNIIQYPRGQLKHDVFRHHWCRFEERNDSLL